MGMTVAGNKIKQIKWSITHSTNKQCVIFQIFKKKQWQTLKTYFFYITHVSLAKFTCLYRILLFLKRTRTHRKCIFFWDSLLGHFKRIYENTISGVADNSEVTLNFRNYFYYITKNFPSVLLFTKFILSCVNNRGINSWK